MEKLNIAEILKDCPKGMELDCTIFENVTFEEVRNCRSYPIKIITDGAAEFLNEYGCINYKDSAKCVIFPKGKTTWEGFQRPFKDGDIVVCVEDNEEGKEEATQMFILKYHIRENKGFCYTGYDFKRNSFFYAGKWDYDRIATEEEREKLFKAIKDNGYKWNAETKTLEKLIEPKFKVGDWIEFKYYERKPEKVIRIENNVYWLSSGATIMFQDEGAWDLTTNKFDINTLVPFESKVLVRDYNTHIWEPVFWGKLLDEKNPNLRYLTTNGCFKYCIPYENNQHLLGTNNDCNDYYKNWE